MIRSAMIMAAGLGTRLRPFTDRIPKPFVPVMGIPAIQFVIDSLAEAGVQHCVLNSHHLHQETLRRIQLLDWHGMRVQVSDESGKLLGSGGGIAKAASLFEGGPFFLANADVLFDLDWRKLATRHIALRRAHGVTLTLTLVSRSTLGGEYREILTDQRGERVTGLGASLARRPFYAGAAVIDPQAVSHLTAGEPYEFVPSILNPAIAAQQVGVHQQEGSWLDVGNPELWARTHFYLMDALETGGMNGPSSAGWARRIEYDNRRVAPGIWAQRKTRLTVGAEWRGPIYVAGRVNSEFSRTTHGPELVAYDPELPGQALAHTIVLKSFRADFRSKS